MPKKIKVKTPKNLDAALNYLHSGNLQQAEAICRQTLQKHPNHSKTLYLLGKIVYYSGQYDNAIQYITRAIHINPHDSYYHLDLGLALLNKGMTDEAIESLHNSLDLRKNSPDIYLNLGVAFSNKGMVEKAIEHFKKAVELNPEFAEAFNNLGVVLEKKGMIDDAMSSYKKALNIKPDYTDAHSNLGNVLTKKGMPDEAVEHYKKALMINPGHAESHNNLGNILKDKKMLDEAAEHYKKALALKPDYADAYNNLGNVLKEKEMWEKAVGYFKKALMLKPDYADAYNNLGSVYKEMEMIDEAIECYKKAIQLKSDYAEPFFNLGILHENKGMLDEAVIYYNNALRLKPDYAVAHWNLSLIMLMNGEFHEGWKKYEWRLLKSDAPVKPFSQPVWDGSPLKDKTLFIYSEQGIGDEIMFASCIPDLIAQHNNCIMECDSRLLPLYNRSFPEITFIPHVSGDPTDQALLPQADLKIALGSLPMFFRPGLLSFPQQKSYILPDENKTDMWLDRFNKAGEGLKIGISWRGGSIGRVKRLRSLFLEQWSEIFSIANATFINLQYGDSSDELLHIKDKSGITIHDWEDSDPLKDLDGFAAQIAALDLVISVDNSTVHMAGAVGTPVWTLIPSSCDWRWMKDFEDTPWYKTVRLFRQKTPGDWQEVIHRIASNLGQFINTGVMPEIKNSYKENTIK